jgi:phosphonate transport system permease protein
MLGAAMPSDTTLPTSASVALVEGQRRDRAKRARRDIALFGGTFAVALGLSIAAGEVDPIKFLEGVPRLFSYAGRTIPDLSLSGLGEGIAEWFWRWNVWSARLFDTIVIAFLATTFAAMAGLAAAFLSARNLVPPGVSWVTRRVLEFLRTMPELVFALIFVFAFGIGPFAGFLAVFVHAVGSLGKLFGETIENADDRAFEALTALGTGWIARVRFAVLPQVLPALISYTLLSFENNVRSASVLGFVGAGGIGQEIMTAIKQFQYTDVSALVLMIAAVVMVVDVISDRIRKHLVER